MLRLLRSPKNAAPSAAPSAPAPAASPVRQLADRLTDGLYVQLLWHPADDSVSVAVDDRRTGEFFQSPVPRDKALFAFDHPFAFAG
jgi:hypothetical protein